LIDVQYKIEFNNKRCHDWIFLSYNFVFVITSVKMMSLFFNRSQKIIDIQLKILKFNQKLKM